MGPQRILPNITTGIQFIFEEILTLIKVGHMVINKKGNCADKNIASPKVQM